MNLFIHREIHPSPQMQLRYFFKLKGLKPLTVGGLVEMHGSEVSCLPSKSWVQCNVFSIWVIKQNTAFSPYCPCCKITVRDQLVIGLFFKPTFQELWLWQSVMCGATAAVHILCLHMGQQIQQNLPTLPTLTMHLALLE
jgi:hypothetical protein